MFPEIKLSDSIVIPTYVLTISLVYCLLIFYVYRRSLKKNLSTTTALDLAFIIMITGFFGGRLTHVFYEMPAPYLADGMRIFKFWEGGFVFYGGFLTALFSCLVFLRIRKLSFFEWADFYAPVIALGYGLGRISCFLAGCCYGRFCELPWAVVFPWDQTLTPRHPTQLYAVIWELLLWLALLVLERKKKPVGFIFSAWLLGHSIGRLVMEYFRDDFRGSVILGLSISTWISLLLLATAGGLLASRYRKHLM